MGNVLTEYDTAPSRGQILMLIRLGVDPARVPLMCRQTARSVIRSELAALKVEKEAAEARRSERMTKINEYLDRLEAKAN